MFYANSVFSFIYTSGSFIMKLPIYSIYMWSWRRDSNPWPAAYETATLPTELLQHMLRRNNHIPSLSSSHRLSGRLCLSCGANRIGRCYPWRFFIWHWSTLCHNAGAVKKCVKGTLTRWGWWTDSNRQSADYKSATLPIELHQHTDTQRKMCTHEYLSVCVFFIFVIWRCF